MVLLQWLQAMLYLQASFIWMGMGLFDHDGTMKMAKT